MMALRIVIDALLVIGAFFALAGTLGVLKMPDTFCRMQASTCITTLGMLGVAIGGLLYAIFIMGHPATAIKIAVIARTERVSVPKSAWKLTISGGISAMSNIVMILNIVVLLGLVVSAIMACHFEKLLSSVIALGVTGIFAAAEFLILQAPDVAISEAAVGAALSPLIFIVALKKIRGGDDK